MSKVEIFESRQIRAIWNIDKKKWYFVVLDVVKVLAITDDHYNYTKKLRKYDPDLRKVWSQLITPIQGYTTSGIQKLNCADAIGLVRIIFSIRSPKAKMFINWLKSLQIDPFEKYGNIKFSRKEMNGFYEILSNKESWMQKRKEILLINKKQPLPKRLNDLELIFSLLEEGDLFVMRNVRQVERMEAWSSRVKKNQTGILSKGKQSVYHKDYKPEK